jgi:hypothetical protein
MSRGLRARSVGTAAMLVDDFLPLYDISDALAVVVGAAPETTWSALMDADLLEVGRRHPLAGVLGALRMLPELASHVLHGEPPLNAPDHLRVRDLARMPTEAGGWILLGERPGEEVAFGLVGKLWRPVIQYAPVPPEDFAGFAEPGWAKTVYALGVRPLAEDATLLSATMRTATTDEHARRWFRRYWTFGVGSGAHVLVNGLLELVRDDAEARGGSRAPGAP